MNVPLQLRLLDAPGQGPPAAWFLPWDSAQLALDELARCGLADPGTRLFLVPRSVHDRALAGFLVVPSAGRSSPDPCTAFVPNPRPGSSAKTSNPSASGEARVTACAGSPPSVSHDPVPRGMPCRLVAGRLYVPFDAIVHPPVNDEELRSICPSPVGFLHPTLGLSGFEGESALGVGDLIGIPEERLEAWNCARAGVEPPPLLRGIVFAQPPTLEDLYGGAEKEIGQDPPTDLPPAPEEPKEGGLARAARSLRQILFKGVIGATKLFPRNATHRTWLNDLADWAGRKLQGVSEQLDQIRNKELHRLLHLLKTDPDAGLRHAISMNQVPPRGVAPPGARLGSRVPDFNAARLGGGPADLWNLTPDWQEVLRRKYRELADREMRLGRFRRAAYIYAELLGDFVSAANVLKQGGHFREAALVYENHLENPLEAARCLAEAGLLPEAIERYEKLGRWLEAADLYERLGDTAAAETLIRRVVKQRLDEDDPIGASKLIDERLHEPDEALAVLLGAWPASRQAATCLTTAFQMFARLGRHEAALEHLARLRREPIPDAIATTLVTGLFNALREYPDRTFRHQAADFTRVIISRQLGRKDLTAARAGVFVDFLSRLAPHDRLLLRDGNRHLAGVRAGETRVRRVDPPPLPGQQPVVVRRIELPRQIEWMELRTDWHWYFAVGVTPHHLTLARGVWDGPFQTASWECPAPAARNGLFFEPMGDQGRAIAIGVAGRPFFSTRTFPAADEFFGQSCQAGTPAWVEPRSLPYSFNEDSAWSIHVAAGRAVLSCRSKPGALQRTIDVTVELLEGATRTETSRVLLVSYTSGAAVALGNRLVLVRSGAAPQRIELPRPATGLLSTLPHTRQGIVALLEYGAVMLWAGASNWIELDHDLPSPKGAFLPGGPLVLLSPARKSLTLLDVDSRGVRKVTPVPLVDQTPVAVSSTASVAQFAVLERTGRLTIYRVP